MKKTAVSLALSVGFGAQPSVTLYGLIDEGFDYASNVLGSHTTSCKADWDRAAVGTSKISAAV